jgi:hypothetical protein
LGAGAHRGIEIASYNVSLLRYDQQMEKLILIVPKVSDGPAPAGIASAPRPPLWLTPNVWIDASLFSLINIRALKADVHSLRQHGENSVPAVPASSSIAISDQAVSTTLDSSPNICSTDRPHCER